MRVMRSFVVVALCLSVIAPFSDAQDVPPEGAEATIREIQQSHIDANVPPPASFDQLLTRDLVAYFASSGGPNPHVAYELLRDGPTQTGIAFPKYYLWVRVDRGGVPFRTGAARVAAIKRERFEVKNFVEQTEIERDPSHLDLIFPAPVVAAIRARINIPAP